jgi:hypothetical protein
LIHWDSPSSISEQYSVLWGFICLGGAAAPDIIGGISGV